MIFIFEGCDAVGKTTAVATMKRVAEEQFHFITKVLHRGPPTSDDIIGEYTSDLDTGEDCILCDRWHWGELIYGPLYRGKSLLASEGHRVVDMELAKRGAVVILLDGDDDVIEHRVRTRGDDFIEVDHTREILKRYREVYAMPTVLSKRSYKFSGDHFFDEDIACEILGWYMF